MTTVQFPENPPELTPSEHQPWAKIMLGSVANIYCRMMFFERAGDREQGHTHDYDHFTLLAAGKLRVTVQGVSTDYVAPYMIFIAKEHLHLLEALEDRTAAYCIHALRDPGGVVLDPAMIPEGLREQQRIRAMIPGMKEHTGV